ncbi:MAG: F0F1 ATP synthase subunit B [Desulfobacterota bacterium]|nr:F0F1 ATP synthase subunit B [Thermodesulfobacteriota bacterium]
MELLKPLGLNFKLLFIQFVGFMILFWMLKKFLFTRVLDMIQRRGEEIRSAYEANEKAKQEAEALRRGYEQKLQEARAEADAILQTARQTAEKLGQEIIEKTRQEAAQIRERGLAEIEQEKKKVITEIRRDVVNLSVDIARRIIDKAVDQREAERLADEVIGAIGSMRT